MAIVFNGVTVDKVIFNGTEMDTVKFGGVVVFEKMPQLATPQNVTADGANVSWDEVENATSYEVIEGGNNVLGTVSATKLINFTIDGTSYQAEEGMTWAQWVASGYNTGNKFEIQNQSIVVDTSSGNVVTYKGINESAASVIIDGGSYATRGGGGNIN